jgi:hypothetical protein
MGEEVEGLSLRRIDLVGEEVKSEVKLEVKGIVVFWQRNGVALSHLPHHPTRYRIT